MADPTGGGSLQRSPIPPSWFRGRGPGEREGGIGKGRRGKGEESKEDEGKGGSPRMPKSRVGKPIPTVASPLEPTGD